MPAFKNFFAELKARNVRKTLAIYFSTALTTIGVIRLFSDAYNLPKTIFPVTVTVFTCGLLSAMIFAWYHGMEGSHKVRRKEALLHLIIGALAVTISLRISKAPLPRVSSGGGKSIAVLPFVNMSENKEDEYFTDGITEDILTQLCKIRDFRVISRTSVMQYKNTTKSLREIGNELDVETILEGSVRRTGNRVRITGQLINARTDEHIWAEGYDRDISDIFAIQADVAKSIARSLQAALSPTEIQQVEKQSTESVEAYRWYLLARDRAHTGTSYANEQAVELFRKSITLDSNYALAYAGLASSYLQKANYDTTRAWLDSARALCKKALTFDENLAEGYKTLGDIRERENSIDTALALYMKAVDLNPNYAGALNNIGYVYYTRGQYDQALRWMKQAQAVQPGSARWISNIGAQYFLLGLDSLAEVWERKAVALQPDFFFPHVVLTYVDMYAKNYDSARRRIAKVLQSTAAEPDAYGAAGDVELLASSYAQARHYYQTAVDHSPSPSEWEIKLAYVLTRLNKPAEAAKIVSRYIHQAPDFEGADAYFLGAAYCIAGQKNEALRFLQKALDGDFRDYRWMSVDPMLDPLRGHAEFTTMLNTLKRKTEEMRNRVQETETGRRRWD